MKCDMCGCESPELETRAVQVEVECCPRCVPEWDAVKLAEKIERKQCFKDLSFRWADGLHGQKVAVYWDEGTHPVHCDSQSKHSVRGTAYRMENAGGGWGQVKVVLDPSENCRVSLACHYTLYCEEVKRDMYHAPPMLCGNTGCKHMCPTIDGQRYGLFLNANGDGNWYTVVSWGCRKSVDLVG